jgi:hypothetical protein
VLAGRQGGGEAELGNGVSVCKGAMVGLVSGGVDMGMC